MSGSCDIWRAVFVNSKWDCKAEGPILSPPMNRALRCGGAENPGARCGEAARRGEWEGEGMWWEWEEDGEEAARRGEEVPVDFDFISLLWKPKDYYKILEVDYDASEEAIRSSYIRLALKWHPDKKQGEENATSRFQEISEAYQGMKQLMPSMSKMLL
ncbi:hypothetical protein E2562_013841 [Oryza meyeriana var. granulata]|uniref:J domain-containing protein n=1 Tax=Oryza meyeriana var. granulata TaxID=110450 RepID=A0A6G1F8C0_9ORYZ|nr:hypothetical protein E2562_013841 [Oryza meyeriana var. granulata]